MYALIVATSIFICASIDRSGRQHANALWRGLRARR